jgi:hypothetical protein
MKEVLLFAMKRLIAIAMLLLPLLAHAEEVEIDGLWYDLNAEDKTAEVMLSIEKVIQAAKEVYKDYPEIIKSLNLE